MKIGSRVQFCDERTKHALAKLESGDASQKALHKHVTSALHAISTNAFCGIQVPKKLIPSTYQQKYTIHNLWKYDLPQGWRLLYSIESNQVIVCSIILEWLSHTEYERRFGYG